MTVKIYTRQYCSYCVRAKRLLNELNVAFQETSIDQDNNALQEMKQKSGRSTVPQIWIGSVHVGGCDELMALNRTGQLIPLLA